MAETIDEQEKELLEQNKLISQYEQEANTIYQEPIPQRRFGSGVTKQRQQQYIERKEKASDYLKQLDVYKEEVNTGLQQVETYKAEEQKYNERKQAFELAERFAERGALFGDERAVRSAYFSLKRKGYSDAYKYYLDLYNYYKQKEKNKPFNPFETPAGTYGVSTPSGMRLIPEPDTLGFSTSEGYTIYKKDKPKQQINNIGKFTYNQGIVTLPPKPEGIIESARFRLGKVSETSNNVFYQGLAGLGASGIGTLLYFKGYAKDYIKNPFLTPIKSVGKPIYYVGERIVSGKGFPEIGKRIKEDTAFSVGYVAGEVLQFKAPNLAIKTIDIARTFKLEKVEAKDIIAPEFFEGQKYPQIKKGQTAGELLEEFKSQGFGYTASPKPLGEKIALKGSSELPGLYQAPKLSATFLRVNGETGIIGANFLPTLKPTTFKIYPKDIELISGVSKKQKKLTPLYKATEFYNKKAELGKSYVPFIKTEKEAIIPAGTLLEELPSKYYFNFEGRRIPIREYKTAGGIKINPTVEYKSVSEISKSYYSYGRVSKVKPINPYSITKSLSSASKLSSSVSLISSSNRLSSSVSKGISSLSVSNSISNSLSKSNSYGISSNTISSKSTSINTPNYPTKPYKPYYPNIPNKPFNPSIPKFKRSYGKRIGKEDLTTAFRTFIKVGGKKTYLTGLREKGSALRFGEDVATKTLRATFGVEATTQKIKGMKTEYKPSNIFRDYKIKSGRRIALQDTYIQKLGKRLSTSSEISELQKSRRRR